MRRLFNRTVRTAVIAALAVPSAAFAQASPSDFTSAARYNAARQVVGTIAPDPDGTGPRGYAAVRNSYDAAGRLSLVETGELANWQSEAIAPASWGTTFTVLSKVEITYDSMNRKTVEKVSGWDGGTSAWVIGSVTQYSYDGLGRLECTAVRMNPATYGALPGSACTLATAGSFGPDRITRNVIDPLGQVTKVQKGVGTALQQDYVAYGYSRNGKRTSVIDANGNRAELEYDGFDRLKRWRFPSSTSLGNVSTTDYEEYAYDANANRTSLRKRDGSTINYSYDALNRMTAKDIPGGTSADVYYGYDLRGLQLSARFVSGSGVGITNVYDGFGRLASTTNDMSGTAKTLSYQWDANGNRTRITHPDSVYFTYAYDGLDRSTAISENGTTTIATMTYDAQGRQSGGTRGAISTAYGYDPVSRLSSLTDDLTGTASDVTTSFSYNPSSQIVSKTRSNDAYAFLGYVAYADISRPYTVNGLNQYSTVGTASFTYDLNGNLIGDGTNTYTYDVENRLLSASGPFATTLQYDPTGRLWRIVLPTKTIELVYDGDAAVIETSGASMARYIHGNGDDDPLVMYLGSGLTDRRSLQRDAQGSIVSFANASGAATNINTYDEYGIPGASNFGRFQYTGQMYIGQIGMYYYKARIYSPVLGRFLQTDPIGYDDQVNLYAYVGNDPTNAVDPDGTTTGSHIEDGVVLAPSHSDSTSSDASELNKQVAPPLERKPGRQSDGSYIAPTGAGTEIGRIIANGGKAKDVIGDGECVTACKHFSGVPGPTSSWRPGGAVLGSRSLPRGTAIATFAGKGRTFNTENNARQNSGIYLGQGRSGGIVILDQWPGHPPQIRELRPHADNPSNSADAYFVIIVR